MDITPTPVPDGEAPAERDRTRSSYDWGSVVPGRWQRWLDMPDDKSDTEAMRACTRIRLAAYHYAKRHGLTLESRRTRKGRTLDLRFTRVGPWCDCPRVEGTHDPAVAHCP